MFNSLFLNELISKIDTRKSRTEGTSGNKNFEIDQRQIDWYGLPDIMDTLAFLEERMPKGSIKIQWLKFGIQKTGVKKFSIKKEYIDDLYSLANRKSPHEYLRDAKEKILYQKNICRTPWLIAYYDERLNKIERRGTLPADWNDNLLDKYLNAVAENTEPIHERMFSLKLGTGIQELTSKTFNNYKGRVCTVIKKYCPDIRTTDNISDNDILRQFNILTSNLYMEFKGALTYSIGSRTFSTEGHETGCVWNMETIRKVVITAMPNCKRVVCIENKANFVMQAYDPETLYIYVHGYLSPAERNICRQIETLCPQAEYYHWSDMDYGGICIFNYMKDKVFHKVEPLHMSASDYIKCRTLGLSGYEITKSTLGKLKKTDAGPLKDLKEEILRYGRGYEQEELLTMDGVVLHK